MSDPGVAFLSQRDLALDIPVNHGPAPGIALRAGCFANNTYEDGAIDRCITNLLDVGFKRFVVDIYFDVGRGLWSLCPAAISEDASHADDASIVPSPIDSSVAIASVRFGSSNIDGRPVLATEAPLSEQRATMFAQDNHIKRQTEPLAASITQNPSILPSIVASENASEPISSMIAADDIQSVLQIGPFSCTATANLDLLGKLLNGYFSRTSNNLEVEVLYLDLNVHAAAPASNPTAPPSAPTLGQLPAGNNFISDVLNSNLLSYIYTPLQLSQQRSNLNASWYRVPAASLPISEYFTLNRTGQYSTPDGWPSEGFITLDETKRVIVSFGSFDPQMSGYARENDEQVIFSSEETLSLFDVTYGEDDTVTSNCFFDANEKTISQQTNNSWAYTASLDFPADGNFSAGALSNVLACGLSPLLNQTILGRTADSDPEIYRSYVEAARIWSWAPGQPSNDTRERCAALYPEDVGRWRAIECSERLVAACRYNHDPYNWTITEERGQFGEIANHCPNNSYFALPYTALENAHLLAAVRENREREDRDRVNDPVFVNIQSLAFQNCWVYGINVACPYEQDSEAEHTRTVVVPTVAAVVVFAVAALTLFVKCAANRTNNKRKQRRKGDDRGDYEGVPS